MQMHPASTALLIASFACTTRAFVMSHPLPWRFTPKLMFMISTPCSAAYSTPRIMFVKLPCPFESRIFTGRIITQSGVPSAMIPATCVPWLLPSDSSSPLTKLTAPSAIRPESISCSV